MSEIAEDRLRQIAILVSSVDSVAARQLLLHLPTAAAQKVRAMASQLGSVSPEEKHRILTEFQKSAATTRNLQGSSTVSDGSRATQGPDAAMDSHQTSVRASSHAAAQPTAHGSANHGTGAVSSGEVVAPVDNDPPESWTQLDVEALLRIVRAERIAVIAVVISQLEASKAAALLQRLPEQTTQAVLQRLATLQSIDPEAMRAIDEHLANRFTEYHHSVRSERENSRRIQALLAAAPTAYRQRWAQTLTQSQASYAAGHSESNQQASDTQTAHSSSGAFFRTEATGQFPQDNAPRTMESPSASQTGSERSAFIEGLTHEASLGNQTEMATSASNDRPHILGFPQRSSESAPQSPETAAQYRPTNKAIRSTMVDTEQPPGGEDAEGSHPIDRTWQAIEFERILELTPSELAELLSSVASKIVLLALAGSTPQFMRRFLEMLEPADARALDARLKNLGPLNLRDIDEAQRILIEQADLFGLSTRIAA